MILYMATHYMSTLRRVLSSLRLILDTRVHVLWICIPGVYGL